MTNDEIIEMYSNYNEDDDDSDLDEFLEDLDRTYETFEERLKRCNITLEELRKRFADFNKWYDGMIERIGAECRQKAIVCTALCRYIKNSGLDDDVMRLWCICESESFDNVLADGYDWDEQGILFNFLSLESDMNDFMYRLKNEKALKNEFSVLRSNISFNEKAVAEITVVNFPDCAA